MPRGRQAQIIPGQDVSQPVTPVKRRRRRRNIGSRSTAAGGAGNLPTMSGNMQGSTRSKTFDSNLLARTVYEFCLTSHVPPNQVLHYLQQDFQKHGWI